MHLKIPVIVILIMTLFSLLSCEFEQKSEYERLLESELNKDVRHDSLFLGYTLGMAQQDFFDHSWNLNQERVVTGGVHVEYKLQDLSHEARMVFYPDFHDEKIYRMPVEISFTAWAIWNRELYSDSLITQLVDHYEEIYGPGFIYTMHPDLEREAWIKIDGNRRISIYPRDDMIARVEFLDLSVDKEN